MVGRRIRVRGTVQGVGLRPAVWRLARDLGLRGAVWNDALGVVIHLWGGASDIDTFLDRLQRRPPPLSHIESLEWETLTTDPAPPDDFRILPSPEGDRADGAATALAADAATCPACLAEVLDPADRRYRYPFTNCTHCGPRLSIVHRIPYDRANTSMAAFPMCPACRAEYRNPADRRFHAQPNACPQCGPEIWLQDNRGAAVSGAPGEDAIVTAARLIRAGSIVAIKGIGGFHLACDAGNTETVARLRRRKRRYHKAFALMARDLEMVRRYTHLSDAEAALLAGPAAPIVVLNAVDVPAAQNLPQDLAPGQNTLGFMLPCTPLHHLLMRELSQPVVLTSGNRSHAPQCTGNDEARRHLGDIADMFLLHNREIVNRLDDSVLRVIDGTPRLLRRARGQAPEPIKLSGGPQHRRAVLAMGGELKNTFCLLRNGEAVVCQHIGDLEDADTLRDYRRSLALYRRLFEFQPDVIAVDRHPDYLPTQLGKSLSEAEGIPLIEVQHHHAHIAACMAEHSLPGHRRVLGVALDGLGMGDHGHLWGGEFLLADYGDYRHLGGFQPIPMPGGTRAALEPWRNTLAHLLQISDWKQIATTYRDLDIFRFLQRQPMNNLETMIRKSLNSPSASSAGRLFDAVAATLGICREQVDYEGQAAVELEAAASLWFESQAGNGYGYHWGDGRLQWTPLWTALLEDLRRGVPDGLIAARFHHGLADAVATTTAALAGEHGLKDVVLTGGVFQNRLLLERVSELLREKALRVLAPAIVPANDGGLSLGQALVGGFLFQRTPSFHDDRRLMD